MNFKCKLPIPAEVKSEYPVSEELNKVIEARNEQIAKIIRSEDNRLMLIIGPCSADNEDSVIDYINRLREVQEKVNDKIFIVPRIYTNKPRTTGKGYKGMLHQPDPQAMPEHRTEESALRAAIARLEAKYREPLVLQVIGGFSCTEIAALLGLGEAAVMTQLFRARQKLKGQLGFADQVAGVSEP